MNHITRKIMAVSGSLRPASTNNAILHIIAGYAPEDVEFVFYEGLGDLPHFNPELDNDTPPSSVVELRKLLKEADGVLICTPEYAHGVPGTLKNALDWTVSSGDLYGKPTALITASTSGEKAHAALLDTLAVLATKIPEEGKLLIQFVRTKVNSKGEVSDPATLQALRSVLDALLQTIGEEEYMQSDSDEV